MPACTYCRLPLTDNEFDMESGYYSSAHSGCEAQNPHGRYSVSILRRGIVRQVRRYTTEARANAEASYLRSWNPKDQPCGADLVLTVHDHGTGHRLSIR